MTENEKVQATKIFTFIEKVTHKLKPHEKEFVRGLKSYFEEKGFLSLKQYNSLLDLYGRV